MGENGEVELESLVTAFLLLLAGLPQNISRFSVGFSCHSFVSFFRKEVDVLLECVNVGDRADSSLWSRRLC